MLNEFLLLQFTFILVIYFFIFFWDSFFLIINAVIYLGTVALFAWLLDADIYINFLIIIDLGVFFVLLGFLLNFISLFQVTKPAISYSSSIFLFLPFLLFIIGASDNGVTNLPFGISFYDWYGIFTLYYFTDLQLLSDLYYIFSSLEFIIMNCYLYTVILVVYVLRQVSGFANSSYSPFTRPSGPTTVRGNFMRAQDVQSQLLTTSSARVWSK